MGKKYGIQCTEDTKEALLASASLLNEKISTIKSADVALGKDRERIVVTTALNLAYELLTEKRLPSQAVNDEKNMKVDALIGRLDSTLKQS